MKHLWWLEIDPRWISGSAAIVAVVAVGVCIFGCEPDPPPVPDPVITSESFEMAQLERFDPSSQYALDVGRYGYDDSMITVNAGRDLRLQRRALQEDLKAPGTPPLLVHLSIRFVYDSNGRINFPPTSFWARYNDRMSHHALPGPSGDATRDPLHEVGWFLDPRTDPYTTMLGFIIDEWADEFGDADGRFGVYFDDFSDLYGPMMSRIGITGQDFLDCRSAFLEGRSWIVGQLRDRFGESIVLTVNYGKDEDVEKVQVYKLLNGICVEGMLTPARRRILILQDGHCLTAGRTNLSTAWNDGPGPELPYPIVRAGSHWMDRNARGEP